jgi:hypothetical protein
MKILTLLALAPLASAQLIVSSQASISGGMATLKAEKDVEVVEFSAVGPHGPYRQWAFQLSKPLVRAGQAWALNVASSVELLSVAYSDGTHEGGDGAANVVRFRAAWLAGKARAEDCPGGIGMILWLQHEGKRLGLSGGVVPAAGRNPNGNYPWFYASSLNVFGSIDGLPISTSLDWAGNKYMAGGCVGPCVAQVQASAACPNVSPWYRSSIGVQGSSTDMCPVGSAGAEDTIYVSTGNLYGSASGDGSNPYQTWGIIGGSELVVFGQQIFGIMVDSCGYYSPEIVSPGGFGTCNGPGGVQ